jgi:mRNA-degrading endonuclease RelE of RelBE toxin-antitoxin system
MTFKIIPLHSFLKEVKHLSKKYLSLKEDLRKLGIDLTLNPKSGTPIGKNCYKVRLQITSKGKGKSGGARVVTHLIINIEGGTLYLLKIYDKADQDNISETELISLLKSIENL